MKLDILLQHLVLDRSINKYMIYETKKDVKVGETILVNSIEVEVIVRCLNTIEDK